MVVEARTIDLVAAILTVPIAGKLIETVVDEKHSEGEQQRIVDIYFGVRRMVKKRFDAGG